MSSFAFLGPPGSVAGVLVYSLGLTYACAGLAVAAAFLVFGLERCDASARGSYAFRPLLVPGLMLLWPLVIFRWRQKLLQTPRG